MTNLGKLTGEPRYMVLVPVAIEMWLAELRSTQINATYLLSLQLEQYFDGYLSSLFSL